jgi:predicted DNA-binding ribbon-helix-helix protein
MAIYLEADNPLAELFYSCNTDQIGDFVPEKKGFRIHGHATTIRLETAFWDVLAAIAREHGLSLPATVQLIYDQCVMANDKNLASCLRVFCLKYITLGSGDGRRA